MLAEAAAKLRNVTVLVTTDSRSGPPPCNRSGTRASDLMFKNQVMVQAGNRPLEPVSVPHETLPAPVVDIESSDAVLQVKQACTTHGFLYGRTDHGTSFANCHTVLMVTCTISACAKP